MPDVQNDLRDTLYGDLPISAWPSDDATAGSPWSEFAEARRRIGKGDKTGAIAIWHRIAQTADFGPRHTLQAWQFLRENGVEAPAAIAKQVLGVVMEVSLEQGLDLLAAYRDHSARYYNQGGGGVVWEHPDNSLDDLIDTLLQAGQVVTNNIGPWEGTRPEAPTGDLMRMSFLTPSGIHFGQAPMNLLAQDPLAGPVIAAGIALMQAMIEKSDQA